MKKGLFLFLFLLQAIVVTAQDVNRDTVAKTQTITEKYDLIIEKAAIAVQNKEFYQAKDLYNAALSLKPQDPFAIKMLLNVDNSLKTMEAIRLRDVDLKRKAEINVLLNTAQKEVMDKNYESARLHYAQVLSLNPVKSQEEFIRQKIISLDFALQNTAKKGTQSPVSANTSSNSNKPAKEETSASATSSASMPKQKDAVNAASGIQGVNSPLQPQKEIKADSDEVKQKPLNVAPQVSSATANAAEAKSSKIDEVQKQKSDDELKGKAQMDVLIESAIKEINQENWSQALLLYNEVLTLGPTALQEEAIKKEIIAINRSMGRAKQKSAELNRVLKAVATDKNIQSNIQSIPEEASSSKSTAAKNSKVVNNSKPAVPQNKEINASANITKTAISSNESASSQIFDSSDLAHQKENIEFSNKILTQPAMLDLSDSTNEVKLICQGITADGKNTFIKFLVQNQSPTANFDIGTLQMVYIQNSGNLKKLNPRYISAPPVILPKKEIPIVYVAETQTAIEPNEVFVFEMEDQMKKTKLILNISADKFINKRTN